MKILIMAGGSGERFWPLSTKENPKQSILVNLSGRGDKDLDYVVDTYGIRE